MISQHWFIWWLMSGKKTFTWANIDTDLCHCMAPLGHSKLRQSHCLVLCMWTWQLVTNISNNRGTTEFWYSYISRPISYIDEPLTARIPNRSITLLMMNPLNTKFFMKGIIKILDVALAPCIEMLLICQMLSYCQITSNISGIVLYSVIHYNWLGIADSQRIYRII